MLLTDEPTVIGPHLLGRKYVADDRDWSVDKLHAYLEAGKPVPPEGLLDMTVRQAIADPATRQFFITWKGILALWAWIKHHLFPSPTPPVPPAPVPPAPVPTPPAPPAPVPPTPPAPVDAPAWADPVVLDQGNYGTCVGNGWAGWLAADPVEDPGVNETLARAIYYEATVIDGQPDNPDAPGGGQQGSTVRSGAQAIQNRKRLSAYAFATTTDQVDEWLNNHGPVVMGTNWYDGMFNPDATGLVTISGAVAGGHCYLCVDKDPATNQYEFVNSWGTSWAQNGHFFIGAADFARLLAEQGDACCAAELPL